LIKAASSGNLANVKGLLDQGADVNAKTTNNATALTFASKDGHLPVMQVF